jgi:hypothetical protein
MEMGHFRKKIAHNAVHYASTSAERRQGQTDEQIKIRRAKDRKRYANMTPKQRGISTKCVENCAAILCIKIP